MRLAIDCEDRVGIAQKVLSIFVEHEINIRGIEVVPPGEIFVNIQDLEFSELSEFMPKLRLIDGVVDVKTVPYMPHEQQRNEMTTLIRTYPDPFISIDNKGNIRTFNPAASSLMLNNEEVVIGQPLGQYIKGFNISRWLEQEDVLAQTIRLKFQDEDFVADMMPFFINEEDESKVLAGAVFILKSEMRLGQQMSAFKQASDSCFSGIQATSNLMKKVVREAKRMALMDSCMLIAGETGTGKELLARACHAASERSDKPFVTLNCASLPDSAAESELFGIAGEDGKATQIGLFERADGGTIFLDEIGEMSAKLQIKLLRVIQDGSFRRVSDEDEVKVNVRIISATNKELLTMVSANEFREDLYYRLNILGLNIPALRERRADILPLAEHFINKTAQGLGKSNITMSEDCREFIEHYPWPGNVRQLENVLTRAVSTIEGNVITTALLQLPNYTREHGYLEQDFEGTLDNAMKAYEADLLRKLYPAYPSSRLLAKKLGLSHTAIANKLREYDINKKTVKI